MCVSALRQQRSAKQRVENGFKSDKSTVAFVRSSQKSGCVSQDVELLEPTVGPANVRRSTLKKSGKISPRSHLELKYTKAAERSSTFGNSWDHLWGSPRRTETTSQPQRANACRQRSQKYVVGRTWCKKCSLAMGQTVVHDARNFLGERSCLHSSHQRWSGEEHLCRPSFWSKNNLWWILVLLCT